MFSNLLFKNIRSGFDSKGERVTFFSAYTNGKYLGEFACRGFSETAKREVVEKYYVRRDYV